MLNVEVPDADFTYANQDLLDAFISLTDDSWLESHNHHSQGTGVGAHSTSNALAGGSTGPVLVDLPVPESSAVSSSTDFTVDSDVNLAWLSWQPPSSMPGGAVHAQSQTSTGSDPSRSSSRQFAPHTLSAAALPPASFAYPQQPVDSAMYFLPSATLRPASIPDTHKPDTPVHPTTSGSGTDPCSFTSGGLQAQCASPDNTAIAPQCAGKASRGRAAGQPLDDTKATETKSRRRARREKQTLSELEVKVAEVQEQLSRLMRENAVLSSRRRVMDILLRCRADEILRLSGQAPPLSEFTTLSNGTTNKRLDIVLLNPEQLRQAFDLALGAISTTALECGGPSPPPTALARLEAQVTEMRQHTKRGMTRTPEKLVNMSRNGRVGWDGPDQATLGRVVTAINPSLQQVRECVTLWQMHLTWTQRLEAERAFLTAALADVLAQPLPTGARVERSAHISATALVQQPAISIWACDAKSTGLLTQVPPADAQGNRPSISNVVPAAVFLTGPPKQYLTAAQHRVDSETHRHASDSDSHGSKHLTESSIMERLVANLLRQKSLVHLVEDALWFPGILSPLQTANMMVHSFPAHPALLSILSFIHSRSTSAKQTVQQLAAC